MSKAELLIPRHETLGSREACGITAIFSKREEMVSPLIVSMQRELQHRGRDSAGIAAFVDGQINAHVGLGKVQEVFTEGFDFQISNLLADRAIGHNRYGTSGEEDKDDLAGAQPVVVEHDGRKIAISYNGNLPEKERRKLKTRFPQNISEKLKFDTLDIGNAIVYAEGKTWEERIIDGLRGIKGAYSLAILTDKGEMFGMRGPSGTWPLWVGESEDKIIFSSETRVKKTPDVEWSEVKAGELVMATINGVVRKRVYESQGLFRCGLHDTYGAKQDSFMKEDVTHEEFRRELGRELARENQLKTDLIIGIPNTGPPIADGFADQLGTKASHLIVAEEIRTFIAKTVEETVVGVNGKYRIEHPEEIEDKTVMLIDDSLIRGKTMGGDPQRGMRGVIDLVRMAGAKEVHLRMALPKFVNGCDMGYYIRRDQLVALVKMEYGAYQELSAKEIADRIGADSVGFLSIKGLRNVYERFFGNRDVVCMHCLGEPHPFDQDQMNENIKNEHVLVDNS